MVRSFAVPAGMALASALLVIIIVAQAFANPILEVHISMRDASIEHFLQNLPERPDDLPLVIFVGSSQMMNAVDAHVVEEKCGTPRGQPLVFNLGSQADSPRSRLMNLRSIETARPDLLVIGLSPLMMNDTSGFGIHESRFLAASQEVATIDPASESGRLLGDEVVRWLNISPIEHSFWVGQHVRGYAQVLLLEAAGGTTVSPLYKPFDEIDRDFKAPWEYIPDKPPLPFSSQFLTDDQIAKYNHIPSLPGTNVAALELIVKRVKATGAEILIVDMPMNPTLRHFVEPSQSNYTRIVQSVVLQTGSRYVDLRDFGTTEQFFDEYHLNRHGRSEFSNEMAKACARLVDAA